MTKILGARKSKYYLLLSIGMLMIAGSILFDRYYGSEATHPFTLAALIAACAVLLGYMVLVIRERNG